MLGMERLYTPPCPTLATGFRKVEHHARTFQNNGSVEPGIWHCRWGLEIGAYAGESESGHLQDG